MADPQPATRILWRGWWPDLPRLWRGRRPADAAAVPAALAVAAGAPTGVVELPSAAAELAAAEPAPPPDGAVRWQAPCSACGRADAIWTSRPGANGVPSYAITCTTPGCGQVW